MASRQIAIRITIDNRDAVNAARAQQIAMQSLNEQTDRHTQLQNGLTNSFIKGNLAARAISASYLAIRDSLKYAAGEAIQFEQNMTKIAVITDTGKASLASLEGTIRGLAVATNQSQNEIAHAALEMGKMGFSGQQLEQALGGVVKLARALDEDIAKTGETVVQVLNAYGFSASDANKITDQLAFTVKASALDIESFGTAFSYVGGTAKAAGVSFTELQGAMDVLSNAGIKASTIGTSLRRIIADLSDPSSKASRAIGGQTVETLGLVGALEALKAKHIDIAGLTEIFGRTASSTSSILIRYAGVVKEMADETERASGLTDNMSKGMNTTLLSSLQGIKTAWVELGLEIAKSTGFLKDFASIAKSALEAYASGIEQTASVRKFQQERPDDYAKAVRRHPLDSYMYGEARVATESPEYNLWKSQTYQAQLNAKDKENSVALLQATFDKNFKAPKNFDPSKQLGLIQVAPDQTDMYRHIEKMWGIDKEGFQEVLRKAKEQFAMKAELVGDEKFDNDSLKTQKKIKNTSVDFQKLDKGISKRLTAEAAQADREEAQKGKQEKKDTHLQAMADSIVGNQDQYSPGGTSQANKLKIFESQQLEYRRIYKDNLKVMNALDKQRDDYKKDLEDAERNRRIAISESILQSSISLYGSLVGHNHKYAIAMKTMAIAEIAINTAIAVSKVWGQTGIFGVAAQVAPILAGAAQIAVVSQQKFATGTDQVVRQPTLMMVGEAGAERVRVTPRSKLNEDEGGSGLVINVYGDIHDADKFQRKVKMALDSNRRSFV